MTPEMDDTPFSFGSLCSYTNGKTSLPHCNFTLEMPTDKVHYVTSMEYHENKFDDRSKNIICKRGHVYSGTRIFCKLLVTLFLSNNRRPHLNFYYVDSFNSLYVLSSSIILVNSVVLTFNLVVYI